MKASKTEELLLAITAAVLAAVAAGCGGNDNSNQAKSAPPPAPVTVSVAAQQSVPIVVTAIGNAQAYRTVQVRSLVDGQIAAVLFHNGDFVKKGQILFELDRRPYQAALDVAEGNLARDEATAANSQAQAQRAVALMKQGVMAVQDAQVQESTSRANAAAVQADKAAVETARVNLGYTEIRAPLDARAGQILVNLGNTVKASDVPLTTLNEITPIYVSFNIPEAQLEAVRSKGIGKLQVIASQPNSKQSETGTLTFIDNTVDATTGTIKLMGTFPNVDRVLWPGEFLNVTLRLGMDPKAVVVPATAIQTGPNGKYVYTVAPNGSATMQPVTSSRNYGALAVIDSGVQPGQQVVVDGQIGIVPNGRVNVEKTVSLASPQQVAEGIASSSKP
jgi:multidrug efflux system membrane fusion protein